MWFIIIICTKKITQKKNGLKSCKIMFTGSLGENYEAWFLPVRYGYLNNRCIHKSFPLHWTWTKHFSCSTPLKRWIELLFTEQEKTRQCGRREFLITINDPEYDQLAPLSGNELIKYKCFLLWSEFNICQCKVFAVSSRWINQNNRNHSLFISKQKLPS